MFCSKTLTLNTMKPTLLSRAWLPACLVILGADLLSAAPATLTQSVTYGGETITLNLTRENLRGSHFEVLVQNSSGTYDTYTATSERSYIGTVDEYPGAVACGIQMDNGTFKGAVYFDRGSTWFTQGSSVTSTRGTQYDTFTDFEYPTSSSVTAGQAGSTTYAYDLGIDAEYGYYSGPGGSSTAKTFELIEYGVCLNRAIYMRDAMLRPYLGRVIIRSDQTQDPYTGLGGGDYLNALKAHWNTYQTDADRDLVAGVCPGKVGGGLAWVGAVGSSNAYSVNDGGSNGHFDVIFRHEMGHNWGCSHFVGGSPEGHGIMGGNVPSRFSGCEVYKVLAHRDNRLSAGGILDSEGTFTDVNLPPYAALDPLEVEIETGKVESVTIDALANDFDANGHSFSLVSYQTTSNLGYPVTVSSGTGANGQDELVYSALGGSGFDFFSYTIEDSTGQTAKGYVFINSKGVTPKLWELATDADTYTQVNSSSNYGTLTNMFLKNLGSGSSYTRAGWVHFDVSGKAYGDTAKITFTVNENAGTAGAIAVWGVVDGADGDELGTDWTETGLTTGNAPVNPNFVEGSQTTYLGSFTPTSGSGSTVDFSSAELLSFLQADTNGEVTFLLLREEGQSSDFSIRSKEHASGGAPTLSTSFSTGQFMGTDSYVRNGSYANNNYGAETEMAIKKDGSSYQREAYLRFDLTSLNDIGTGKVLLNLTALQTQPGQTYRIRLVDDSGDGWSEQGLTYNNRPVGSGTGVTFTASEVTANTPFSVDVTDLFSQVSNSNGAATFHIDALSQISTGFTRIATRENATAAYRPSITIIDQDPHDAYVRNGGYAGDNFGSDTGLVLKNDGSGYYREFFLRRAYDDNGGNPVAAATLTLTPVGITGTRNIRLRLLDDADDEWKEDEITYNNRPTATGSEVTFSSSAMTLNTPFAIDVTSLLNQSTINGNGVASFQVDLPGSTGSAYYTFASKEHGTSAYHPVLNVNPNAPVAADSSSDINSGSAIGATAATAGASDADGDSLSYAITAGNGAGLFAINSGTGVITTTANVEVGQHVLTVTVTDGGVPAVSDSATITINVVTADSDGDYMDDGWEVATFGSIAAKDGTADTDSDGLTDAEEYLAGSDPFSSDSDLDGFADVLEVAASTDPADDQDYPDSTYSGLHVWWNLDEVSSATTVYDNSGSGLNATVNGATLNSSEATFDGVDDNINAGTAAAILGTGDYSISIRMKTATGFSATGTLIQQRDPGSTGYQGEYMLNVNANGTLSYFIYNSGYQVNLTTTATVNDGNWHHILAVRSGSTVTVYVDGTQVAQGTGTAKELLSRTVTIGYDNRDSNKYFNGSIKDVRLYDRAVDATEF